MKTTAFGMVLMMVTAGSAPAAIYTEDFHAGAGGFATPNSVELLYWYPAGGVSNGYIEVHKADALTLPRVGALNSPASTGFAGDLVSKYGPHFSISYDLYVGSNVPAMHSLLAWDGGANSSFWGIQTTAGSTSGWQHVELDINANWTDAEAQAAGWTRWDSGGTGYTFSQTVRAVYSNYFQRTTATVGSPISDAWIALDNAQIQTINQAFTPTFSPGQGSYAMARNVTITCATDNATIYYTTNGINPDDTSTRYTGPITVSDNLTLKAIAYATGLDPSDVASATYEFPAKVIHTATFDADLEGWNGYAPGGYFTRMANSGVGNSGFLYAYRPSWYPTFYPNTAPATTYFQNDLRGIYGPQIRLSAYVEFINGVDKGCALEFQGNDAPTYTQWQKVIFAVGQTPTTWTPYAETINMDWTDTDAQANGWVRIYGSASWTSTVGNIYQTKFFTQVNGSGSAPDVSQIIGLDQVTMEGVNPAAMPTLNPEQGYYSAARSVTISCTTPGATVYYTTNGIDPDNTSTPYTIPITISDNLTLKAIAYAIGFDPSAVASATYWFPTSYNRPASIPYGTATIDGNLSDWADATWAPIDQPYYPDDTAWPTDIPHDNVSCYYAVKWTPDKIYLAVKVLDMNHQLTTSYEPWDGHDGLEIYLHTTGTGPASGYYSTYADAQQYEVGIKPDNATVWSYYGDSQTIPGWAGFSAAGSVVGNWLYYEVAMTPFHYFNPTGSGSVVSSLNPRDVIGLDVVVSAKSSSDFWQIAENQMKWKSADYSTFGVHLLTDPNGDGELNSADLAIVLAALDKVRGQPGFDSRADLDGDGEVTSTDLSILLIDMD